FNFALIGGYAVNCYALPRFSVDCDIVVDNAEEAAKIGKELENFAYKKEAGGKLNAYDAAFARYQKKIKENFKVSFDILIGYVLDRQGKSTFSAEWVFENSELRLLKGKTIVEQLKLRVISPDALFAMKFAAGRATDIRDVFMLVLQVKSMEWIKEEASKRCNFKERFDIIKNKVTSQKFKDDLQGVFGYVDEKLFERHKKALAGMG
ncbi:MAG: nucleotidyl transferase AbiEii/AbiGii toxin family protein, partial [Nanoarchaeota archaeon]